MFECLNRTFRLSINENAVCHRNDSGISSSKDMFDVERIAYYQELYTYFTQCLQPVLCGKSICCNENKNL